MKALTLWQPWASLVAEGVKTIETRSWPAPQSLIGERIAIHASKKKVGWGADCPYEVWAPLFRIDQPGRLVETLPLGEVIATARLADCVPIMPAEPRGAYVSEFDDEGDSPHQRGGLWLTGYRRNEWSGAYNGTPLRIEEQRPFGDYAPNRWAWLLDDVQKIVPVPTRGRQRLWEFAQ